jgi:hypothetical protein
MKNLTILLFSLFFLSINTNAQDLKYNKQYALNGSTILSGLIDLPNSPYQFSVKTYGNESNKRFQIGIDLGANITVSDFNFSGGFGIIARSGKERFEDFGKNDKWRVFFGTDGVYSIGVNVFGDNARIQLGAGVAPFAGLQYRINERLSVYTEASYQAILSITPASGEFGISINGSFLPPAALWIAFDMYKVKKEEPGENN